MSIRHCLVPGWCWARHVYTIVRLVLFKDDLLVSARPALGLRRRDGSLFRDREGLAWANPYSREVWRYNIDLAVEAARAGFDEIQSSVQGIS